MLVCVPKSIWISNKQFHIYLYQLVINLVFNSYFAGAKDDLPSRRERQDAVHRKFLVFGNLPYRLAKFSFDNLLLLPYITIGKSFESSA